MKKYVCDVCGYVYDPAKGDPRQRRSTRHSLRGSSRGLGLP